MSRGLSLDSRGFHQAVSFTRLKIILLFSMANTEQSLGLTNNIVIKQAFENRVVITIPSYVYPLQDGHRHTHSANWSHPTSQNWAVSAQYHPSSCKWPDHSHACPKSGHSGKIPAYGSQQPDRVTNLNSRSVWVLYDGQFQIDTFTQ